MDKFVALLRGINVGGNNKIKMQHLKRILTSRGLQNVETYIQSGNIVFQSDRSASHLEKVIFDAIEEEYGYQVSVMVFEGVHYKVLVEQNPFEKEEPTTIHFTFLSGKANSQQGNVGLDYFEVIADCAYVCCPNGYGKTKLTIAYFEKLTGFKATARNFRTAYKLIELLEA